MNTDSSNFYALRVALEFTSGSSDKFYNIVILPHKNLIAVHYGRVYTAGHVTQYAVEDAKLATKAWSLLRTKVGKGYVVTKADVVPVQNSSGDTTGVAAGDPRTVLDIWQEQTPVRHSSARLYLNRSPRPTKEGSALLRELMSEHPDPDMLFILAFAEENEDFLRKLAFAHPQCPETAHIVRELMVT